MLPCGSFLRISTAFVLILSHAYTAFTFSLTFFDFAFARYRIVLGGCLGCCGFGGLKAGPPQLRSLCPESLYIQRASVWPEIFWPGYTGRGTVPRVAPSTK